MKILRIAGRNLASLAGDFEVDFQSGQLASAGLFAISGPTGAGKSTLLDALCLALYDATPRLLKVNTAAARLPDVGDETVSILDPRTLLRRGAAEGFAEVDFEAGDGQRYRARWSVRRSRNKPNGILQRADMTLHTLPGLAPVGRTNKEVLAEIAQRIGLSFEQFTRSVLLAQNEFSAFLKTEENERGELLETLTGSTIYSSLSRRAFERYRDEQAKLKQVEARLADQVPMAAEQRSATEAAHAAAAASLAGLEPRKQELERQVRWFEDDARLSGSVNTATVAARQADEAHAAAQARREQLDAIDRVQGARPLLAEVERLSEAGAALEAALAGARNHAAACSESANAARQQAVQAAAEHEAALAATRAAQPGLDQAKAHDARLAALEGPHTTAGNRRAACDTELAQLQARLSSIEQAQAANSAALAAGQAWLGAHQAAEALARQWERWDALLERAAEWQTAIATEERAREVHASTLLAASARRDTAQQDAAASQQAFIEAGTARDAAVAALAQFDLNAIQASRAGIEHRTREMQSARDTWRAWQAAIAAETAAAAEMAELQSQLATVEQETVAIAAALGPLEATAAQADKSLAMARLACAENVESLRSQLEDDQPCPVCGSEEHPYASRDPALHTLLAQFETEAAQAAARLETARTTLATLRERSSFITNRHATAADAHAALAKAAAAEAKEWHGHPGHHSDAGEDYFQQCAGLIDADAASLAAQEQALREALTRRDLAQQALDTAMRARDAAAKASDEAATSATAAQALLDACLTRTGQLRQSLDSALSELDAPLSKISNVMIEEFEHGWQPAWRGDPAAMRTRLAGLADTWSTHAAELVRCQQVASELAHQKTAMQAARDRVQADLLASASEHDRLGEAISVLREQRLQLFEGRAVAEVEQALQARQQAAADRHTAASASAAQAAEQAGLAQAALNNANEAVVRNAVDMQAARTAVAEWISAHPGTTEEGLAQLLAHSTEWVREERALLARIDQEKASAQAVLKERLSQLEQHRSQAQPGPQPDEAGCRAALSALATERDAALAQAAQLRRALDQDDLRRASAQSLQAELERQQLEERRWARMNELIGSSDGKKFRNYAQQFTLDVLLGYANAHLQQLARRYRLERVASASGPSLGLMVRDQDMGGEIRSVNSLSGGESFLVSLALALGLASLSSNRVKVESLFIDEGFGSLDSDTLRVAMEALDGLQASGRRVGVISHVQEMTERIAVRIMVVPTGGGGSTVRI